MIVTILLLLITIVIIAFTFDFYVHHKKAGQLLDQIPGRKGVPILGNKLQIYLPRDKLWLFFCNMMDKYYPITKIWAFHIPVVSIRHPDDLEVTLNNTKNIEKSILYKILIPWLNTGLLTSGEIFPLLETLLNFRTYASNY
ncbi:PREDICTED: cytochrome P450 4C1-like isoform X2 [Dinoponera quadriceps]|uniref:Cytochrome P450 4C1-like isoform X2 n=1 Tax=Dinoponera quadriceps TaxID=609295 RepID=A0A6P3Y8J7_DINQU|nr:PREDICTED: cytochrome P450 4C1-like isoform X2 [Dinoponera quadriceps]